MNKNETLSVLHEKTGITPPARWPALCKGSPFQGWDWRNTLEAPGVSAGPSPTYIPHLLLHCEPLTFTSLSSALLTCAPPTHTHKHLQVPRPVVWLMHLYLLEEVTGGHLAEHPERSAPRELRSANFPLSPTTSPPSSPCEVLIRITGVDPGFSSHPQSGKNRVDPSK